MSYYRYTKKRKYRDRAKYRVLSSGAVLNIINNTITYELSKIMSDIYTNKKVILEIKQGEFLARLKCDKYTIGFVYIDNDNKITKYELCYDDISTFFKDVNIRDIKFILDYYIGQPLETDQSI